MYLSLAWRNLWRNRRRTLITISSIFFAVIIAVMMRSMQVGTYDHIVRNVVRYTGYAQIHANGFWDEQTLDNSFQYSTELVKKVDAREHIELVIPRLESFALASTEELTKGVLVFGIDPPQENKLTNLKDRVIEGDYLQMNDEGALIGEGLAKYLHAGVGDTLIMIGQGYHGTSAAGKFPIRGLVKFPTPDFNNQVVYLNLKQAQTFYGAPQMITSLVIQIDHQNHLVDVVQDLQTNLITYEFTRGTLIDLKQTKLSDEMVETLTELNGKTYVNGEELMAGVSEIIGEEKAVQYDAAIREKTANFEIMRWEELMPEIVQGIQIDNAWGIVMLLVLYVVIGFGIFNTLLMMIAERKREFAVLVAVGMKPLQLVKVVLIESVLIALTGAVLGIIASIPPVAYFFFHPIKLAGQAAESALKYGFEPLLPFSMDPRLFVMQAVVVLILAFLAAIYPLSSLLKLNVVKSMRS